MSTITIIDPTDFIEPVPVSAVIDKRLLEVAYEMYDALVIGGAITTSFEEFLGACLCCELEHLAVLTGYLKGFQKDESLKK